MAHLDLTSLEIFRQVAIDGTISGAAKRLNRVQSNISTRIRQLEERLGFALFTRHQRGLSLTEDGETLLRYAERLLALSDEAVEALHATIPTGTFKIGTMESTAASRLPDILSRYHAAYPKVSIQLTTDTAGGLVRRLLDNDIDAAFVAEPLMIAGVRSMPVFEEQLILVAPLSFPAMNKVEEISGKTMIAFEEGCAYRRYLNEWLADAGIVPGQVMSVGSYVAILACVSAGAGYAVVPKSVLNVISSMGEFREHKLPRRYCRIKTLLAWRGDYDSNKLAALKQMLRGETTA